MNTRIFKVASKEDFLKFIENIQNGKKQNIEQYKKMDEPTKENYTFRFSLNKYNFVDKESCVDGRLTQKDELLLDKIENNHLYMNILPELEFYCEKRSMYHRYLYLTSLTLEDVLTKIQFPCLIFCDYKIYESYNIYKPNVKQFNFYIASTINLSQNNLITSVNDLNFDDYHDYFNNEEQDFEELKYLPEHLIGPLWSPQ